MDNGRPLWGEIAFNRRTWAKFHYAIRFINKEKSRIGSNRMTGAIANKHTRNLCMDAKKIKKTIFLSLIQWTILILYLKKNVKTFIIQLDSIKKI